MPQRTAIMQPYLLPYIGYFQLIAAADVFVVYDDIKYTKKGWINRNRLLLNGQPWTFSLPLQAGSDRLDVVDRQVATGFLPSDLLRKIEAAYRNAPFFEPTMALAQAVLECREKNLFNFLLHGLQQTLEHLQLRARVVVSSTLAVDRQLRGQDRVIATCRSLGATEYLNAIGGTELYDAGSFANQGLQLSFLRSRLSPYAQTGQSFVPALSILDVLFFKGRDATRSMIATDFDIVSGHSCLETSHAHLP